MKKVLAILGTILIVVGVAALVGGFAMNDWKAVGIRYEEKSYNSETLDFASINLDLWNSEVVVTRGEKLSFAYAESEHTKVNITEEEGVLQVTETRVRHFLFDGISWFNSKPAFRLTIPKDCIPELSLFTTNGKLSITGKYADIVFKTTNGKLSINEVEAKSLKAETTNGAYEVVGLTVLGNAELFTTNGAFEIDGLTAGGNVALRTSNGFMSADNVTCAGFTAKTTNGVVKFSRLDAKSLSFSNTNGKIQGSVAGLQAEYNIRLATTNGTASPANQTVAGATRTIDATSTNGNIIFSFGF